MADDVGLALLLALFGGVYFRHRWKRWQWRVRVRSLNDTTYISVQRGTGLFGHVRVAALEVIAEDYDQKLADAEAQAFDKCAALNASEKVNKRRRK